MKSHSGLDGSRMQHNKESGMRRGRGLLVLSKESWSDVRWARKQWLPYWLARTGEFSKIIYVNRHRAWWQGETADTALAPHDDVPVTLQQFNLLLPGESCARIRDLNRRRIGYRLAAMLDPGLDWLCLYYHPYDLATVQQLTGRASVVFDWTEDWAEFHGDTALAVLQRDAVVSASAVLVVSETLQRQAEGIRADGRVFLLPNATSLEPVSEEEGDAEPAELAAVPRPRLAYAGHLGPWFDAELVAELAARRPEWSWVMVGGVTEAVCQRLVSLGNIHWLGVKSPAQLPVLMRYCDVLVAPYRAGIAGDATKLYDYLSVGLPVVSTPCDTASRLSPYVRTATGVDAWLHAIEAALRPSSEGAAMREAARAHHWSSRAGEFLAILDRLGSRK